MNNKKKPVILFDVNETLLDMTPLRNNINGLLRNENAFKNWFYMLLHHSLVANSIADYHDFSAIAKATLQMAAQQAGITVADEECTEALAAIKKLPAHPDVKEGLQLLKQNGFRLATLTNSPPGTMLAQLEYAGISHYFDVALSIDSVKKYKPAPETYRWAAQQVGEALSHSLLVAAHGWDIAGALHAGMEAAFIARQGQVLYPLSGKPAFEGNNLPEIAQQMVASFS